MWKVEATENEGDGGAMQWEVLLVNGETKEYAGGGYYFIHNDPDGDDFNQSIADAEKEAERRNELLNERKHQSWEK